jgi:hypothetical protein
VAEAVSTVTICRFKHYDIADDDSHRSRRRATRTAIERLGGEVLENTATEVDQVLLGGEIPGMTARDFEPNPRTGFQSQVNAGMRS